MKEAVKMLDFETAAILRDELEVLRNKLSNLYSEFVENN